MICKRCSFECNMGKYIFTLSCDLRHAIYVNWDWTGADGENTALVQWLRCEPLGEHLIHWTFAVFSKNEQRVYFHIRSSHTWHNCHRLQFKLQLHSKQYRFFKKNLLVLSMQPLENPARVRQGLHGNSTEGFLLKNVYCLECRVRYGLIPIYVS